MATRNETLTAAVDRTRSIIDVLSKSRVGPLPVSRLLGVVAVFALWSYVASIFPMRLLPFPWEAISISVDLVVTGVAWKHLAATLSRTLWGFAGAFAWGLVLGTLMGINDYSQRFFTPYVVVGLSVPGIAWAAITTLVFGLNIYAPVTAVILTTFPYIAVNVWKGVEAIEADLVKMSQSFHVSYRRILTRLIIPTAAPSLFSAARFGLAISWKVETNAEVFAATSGVGFKTIQEYQSFDFAATWGWAILFMTLILLVEYLVFKPLERRVFSYREDVELSLI